MPTNVRSPIVGISWRQSDVRFGSLTPDGINASADQCPLRAVSDKIGVSRRTQRCATSDQTSEAQGKHQSQDEAAYRATSLDALVPVAGGERLPQPSPDNSLLLDFDDVPPNRLLRFFAVVNTIGIVFVAAIAVWIAMSPAPAQMTAALRLTRSAAMAGSRSN
jgi:hypothetical protein